MTQRKIIGSVVLLAIAACQTPPPTDTEQQAPPISLEHSANPPAPPPVPPIVVPGARGVTFATFAGGSDIDMMRDVVESPSGLVYVVGGTKSRNFPAMGGFKTSFGGMSDAVIAAYTASGSRVWSALLGGSGFERAYAAEWSPDGTLVIAGRAGPGLPNTTGRFQAKFGGGTPGGVYGPEDGFTCKIAADGRQVLWCSYLGTSDNMIVRDVAVDGQGFIYLAASVEAGNLPAAWFANGFRKTRAGGRDGLLVKVAPDGSKVIWATYVGGSNLEAGEPSVRVAPNNDVVFEVVTRSTNMPTTSGVTGPRFRGGNTDAWVGRFSSAGALIWGTYVGGTGAEAHETHNLWVDQLGRIYVGGSTTSPSLQGVTGGFQPRFGGAATSSAKGSNSNYPGDGYLILLSADGRSILGGTYLGGAAGDGIEGISVDGNGIVWVAGATFSGGLKVTAGAYEKIWSGAMDGFVGAFTADLKQAVYLSYLGTGKDDGGRAIVGRKGGGSVFVGTVGASAFPLLAPVQAIYGGNNTDGLIVGLR